VDHGRADRRRPRRPRLRPGGCGGALSVSLGETPLPEQGTWRGSRFVLELTREWVCCILGLGANGLCAYAVKEGFTQRQAWRCLASSALQIFRPWIPARRLTWESSRLLESADARGCLAFGAYQRSQVSFKEGLDVFRDRSFVAGTATPTLASQARLTDRRGTFRDATPPIVWKYIPVTAEVISVFLTNQNTWGVERIAPPLQQREGNPPYSSSYQQSGRVHQVTPTTWGRESECRSSHVALLPFSSKTEGTHRRWMSLIRSSVTGWQRVRSKHELPACNPSPAEFVVCPRFRCAWIRCKTSYNICIHLYSSWRGSKKW